VVNLHNAKRPTRLEHRTLLIHIVLVPVARNSDKPEISAVRPVRRPSRAVRIRNASELIYCANEGADETKVDESDEFRGVLGARIQEQRAHCPYCAEHADDEEDENRARCEEAACVVIVNEVG
jgi:hypothetical protein